MPMHDANHPHDPTGENDPNWAHSQESGDFMTLHQGADPASKKAGYELTDANVRETGIFLIVLGAALAVVFVLAFGIGKLINMNLASQDGPTNKWSRLVGAIPGNLESDPQMKQEQLQRIVKQFPTPRLQIDDGNVEVADMHAREDMMLFHYTWIDQEKQTVRIPISRAMQLLVERGLPVEQGQKLPPQSPIEGHHLDSGQLGGAARQMAKGAEAPMYGDASETVTAPLTNGFARTGPELRMTEAREQQFVQGSPHNPQAAAMHSR